MEAALLPDNVRRLPFDGTDVIPWFSIGQKAHVPLPWPHPQAARAAAGRRCWLCGRERGSDGTFLLPLEGALWRHAHEQPAHWGCAEYAATTWLPRGRLGWFNEPKDRRLAWLADPDDDRRDSQAARVACLWRADIWYAGARNFLLGEPTRVAWFAGGKPIEPGELRLDLAADKITHDDILRAQRLRPFLP